MADNVYSGNANDDAGQYRGWLLGSFVDPTVHSEIRKSDNVEIKWGIHPKGDQRAEWTADDTRTTVLLLVSGRFRLDLTTGQHHPRKAGRLRRLGARHRPLLAGRRRQRGPNCALVVPPGGVGTMMPSAGDATDQSVSRDYPANLILLALTMRQRLAIQTTILTCQTNKTPGYRG